MIEICAFIKITFRQIKSIEINKLNWYLLISFDIFYAKQHQFICNQLKEKHFC